VRQIDSMLSMPSLTGGTTMLALLRLASDLSIGPLAGSGLGVSLFEANLDGSPGFYGDWEMVRDRWRTANLIRSAAAIIGFVLLLILLVGERRAPVPSG
jgi:hypothetical protein